MEDTEEVFEDALDDVVEATEININALNNNKPAKSSSRSFKLKNKKHEKHRDSCWFKTQLLIFLNNPNVCDST